jgi:hypothetical protein
MDKAEKRCDQIEIWRQRVLLEFPNESPEAMKALDCMAAMAHIGVLSLEFSEHVAELRPEVF